jgi:hypothetical protein
MINGPPTPDLVDGTVGVSNKSVPVLEIDKPFVIFKLMFCSNLRS